MKLSKTSVGCLPAFTAGLGGIIAQEVLKALTGMNEVNTDIEGGPYTKSSIFCIIQGNSLL